MQPDVSCRMGRMMRWSSWKEIVRLTHWCCCHLRCVIWWPHPLCILDWLSHTPHHFRCLEVCCWFRICKFLVHVKCLDLRILKCKLVPLTVWRFVNVVDSLFADWYHVAHFPLSEAYIMFTDFYFCCTWCISPKVKSELPCLP